MAPEEVGQLSVVGSVERPPPPGRGLGNLSNRVGNVRWLVVRQNWGGVGWGAFNHLVQSRCAEQRRENSVYIIYSGPCPPASVTAGCGSGRPITYTRGTLEGSGLTPQRPPSQKGKGNLRLAVGGCAVGGCGSCIYENRASLEHHKQQDPLARAFLVHA